MAIGHQALRCAIPTSANVFGEWRVVVQAAARAEISQFDRVTR